MTDYPCVRPGCTGVLRPRSGIYGAFLGCTAYPACDILQALGADGQPTGQPSDKATRTARQRAHAVFDGLWRRPRPSEGNKRRRSRAYAWLAETLEMEPSDCHIANFDVQHCESVVIAVAALVGDAEVTRALQCLAAHTEFPGYIHRRVRAALGADRFDAQDGPQGPPEW